VAAGLASTAVEGATVAVRAHGIAPAAEIVVEVVLARAPDTLIVCAGNPVIAIGSSLTANTGGGLERAKPLHAAIVSTGLPVVTIFVGGARCRTQVGLGNVGQYFFHDLNDHFGSEDFVNPHVGDREVGESRILRRRDFRHYVGRLASICNCRVGRSENG
jgi:hypothetical protein